MSIVPGRTPVPPTPQALCFCQVTGNLKFRRAPVFHPLSPRCGPDRALSTHPPHFYSLFYPKCGLEPLNSREKSMHWPIRPPRSELVAQQLPRFMFFSAMQHGPISSNSFYDYRSGGSSGQKSSFSSSFPGFNLGNENEGRETDRQTELIFQTNDLLQKSDTYFHLPPLACLCLPLYLYSVSYSHSVFSSYSPQPHEGGRMSQLKPKKKYEKKGEIRASTARCRKCTAARCTLHWSQILAWRKYGKKIIITAYLTSDWI